MSQVSRPMQILLAATVLFAAAWFVALRPKPSAAGGAPASSQATSAPTAPGVKGLTTAIRKAHGAVATANGAAAPQPHVKSATPAVAVHRHAARHAHRHAAVHHAARHAHRHHRAVVHHQAARRAHRRAVVHRHAARRARHHTDRAVVAVRAALRHHRAIALAFVDPGAADSRALAHELARVSHFGGRAVVLAVPIGALSSFGAITREVQITTAPTTVIVAPNGRATTIVGFADRFELEQRLADAVARHRG